MAQFNVKYYFQSRKRTCVRKIEREHIDLLNTQHQTHYICIDLTNITYIGIHDTSRSLNGGSRLLKIASTTINLETRTITTHNDFEVMEALIPITCTHVNVNKQDGGIIVFK